MLFFVSVVVRFFAVFCCSFFVFLVSDDTLRAGGGEDGVKPGWVGVCGGGRGGVYRFFKKVVQERQVI